MFDLKKWLRKPMLRPRILSFSWATGIIDKWPTICCTRAQKAAPREQHVGA